MADYRNYPTASTAYQPYDNFHPQVGLREESIAIMPPSDDSAREKNGFSAASGTVPSDDASAKRQSSYEYSSTSTKKSPSAKRQKRLRLLFWGIKYALVVILVAVALAIPIIIFHRDNLLTEEETVESIQKKQYKNLVYYIFSWLEVTWVVACLADIFILAFPYLFRVAARYVNPAQQRYWRIFRSLRKPVTLLGAVGGAYTAFDTLIPNNIDLAVNIDKVVGSWGWDDTIDDILQQGMFWVVFYLVEKVFIMYISVHYHYRSDQGRITHSKELHGALVTLYDASVYLHPVNSRHFVIEDALIHGAKPSSGKEYTSTASRKDASKFLSKIGVASDKMTSFFGNFKTDEKSHWMDTKSSYTVIERALSNPKSAAALAKRIWMSLVVRGKDCLTAEDIAEVLGPYRREEALEVFKALDENDSGDLRLEEMVWTVVEAGRIRHSIYAGMKDIDHCINTFEWIVLIFIAVIMIFFIAVLYIPTIKEIQNTVSFIAVGLSFALGRTLHKFAAGCIFVFFEHPFDVGDRVEVYNMSGTNPVSCIVTRQSILYTIFRRVDNGTDLQITNERLAMKRVENVTRSGVNKEQRTIFVDFKTTFVDIMFLRTELEAFLKDNSRDYLPALGLSIVNLHELNKLEIKVSVTHKSNWSDERLRATRSNKFMCALVTVIRKIPLNKPGGLKQGDEGRPIYQVTVTDEEALKKMKAAKDKEMASRIDTVKAEPAPEKPSTSDAEADAKVEERRKKKATEDQAKAKEKAALAGLTKIPEIKINKTNAEDIEKEGLEVVVSDVVRHVETGLRMKPGMEEGMIFHR